MKITFQIFTLSCLFFYTNEALAAKNYALIKKMRGKVTVEEEIVKVGSQIEIGKVVTARQGSFADIVLPSGAVMRLIGGSFKIEEMKIKKSVINLMKGRLFNYVRPEKLAKKHIIKTSRSSFAVRGTRFVVDESEENSFLCVCEGEVDTHHHSGKTARFKTGEYIYINGSEKNMREKVSNVWFPFVHKSVFNGMDVK